jgi:hypothetical protein
MAFLPEGAEFAAEILCRAHSALITLDGGRIGELRAVVSEHKEKEGTEELLSCHLSQHVKDINDRLCIVPIPKQKHVTAVFEHEQDSLFKPEGLTLL